MTWEVGSGWLRRDLGPPTRVRQSTYWMTTQWGGARNLARDSKGWLWCCYSRPSMSGPLLCVAHSQNNGVTWTEQIAYTSTRTVGNRPSP